MSIPSSGSSTWRRASTTSSRVGIEASLASTVSKGHGLCLARDMAGARHEACLVGTVVRQLRAEQADFLATLGGEEVDPVDEAHPVAARAHHDRVRPRAVREEADTT